MKKVLILGPISDFGGRELMSVFIANCLSTKFNVDILSLGDMSPNSVVVKNYKKGQAKSIKEFIFKKNWCFYLLASFSYLKNKKLKSKYLYVKNKWSIALGYQSFFLKVLSKLINTYDLIFINAQLSSSHMAFVLECAKHHNLPIIFRTTGEIHQNDLFAELNHVDWFIHHSKKNANHLKILKNHKYSVIGQSTTLESQLLTIKPKTKIKNFLFAGRLDSGKGIKELIDFFIKYPNDDIKLNIAGDGALKNNLVATYSKDNKVNFLGYLNQKNLVKQFEYNDCLIISSYYEAGPLVGAEAMASGLLMLSTKVGAMEERLNDTLNNFWFNISDYQSFYRNLTKILSLNSSEVKVVSEDLKKKYDKNYSLKSIESSYREVVNQVFNLTKNE